MKRTFYTELKTDKYLYSRTFNFLIPGVILGYFSYASPFFNEIKLIGILISMILIFIGLVLATERISLRFDGLKLIIDRKYLGISNLKHYELKKMRELRFDKNVKSNQYRKRGEVKVMGMDMTPENMKKYYYHPEIVSFKYENKRIQIGKWKKPFEGKKLFSLLKERIN